MKENIKKRMTIYKKGVEKRIKTVYNKEEGAKNIEI
jgi:hypothetical protein